MVQFWLKSLALDSVQGSSSCSGQGLESAWRGDVPSWTEILLSWGLHHQYIHIQVAEFTHFHCCYRFLLHYLSHILLLIMKVYLQVAEVLIKKKKLEVFGKDNSFTFFKISS